VFTLDPGPWLEPEPRVELDDGVVYGPGTPAASYDARAQPLLSLAWSDEAPEGTPHAQLFDLEDTTLGGVPAPARLPRPHSRAPSRAGTRRSRGRCTSASAPITTIGCAGTSSPRARARW
jgi:hypothetical protein